jgi:probable F420-dependent oxidoreductase
MKFGLSLAGLSPRHHAEVARHAEAAGFESLWMPEHLVLPDTLPATYPYTGTGEAPITSSTAAYDPWVVLGAIAASTTTIRLATNVYILPLRHPIVTARAVLTLDRVSHGRVTLGVGVGWLEEEFTAVGENFHTRGSRTDEIIPLLRRLWTEPVVEHDGEHYRLPPVRFEPKPFQHPIPIEIGGTSAPALRRAGRIGDGWLELGSADDDALGAAVAVVREERRRAGREQLPFQITTQLTSGVDRAKRLADLGVTRLIVSAGSDVGGSARQHFLDAVSRTADEFIGQL